jgi:hypothetical protein
LLPHIFTWMLLGEHMKKRWTEVEIATLKNWYAIGMPEFEIAQRMGRTIGSVSNARQAYKIHRPSDAYVSGAPWSEDEITFAKHLYECGIALGVIAQSVSRTSISIKRMAHTKHWVRPDSCKLPASWFNTDSEHWRPACCFGYAVSNLGNVMSLQPNLAGKRFKKWKDKDGYEHVALTQNGITRRYSVHRLIAISFLESAPFGDAQVAHINGTPWDNRAKNLRWSTAVDNQQDRIHHSTAPRGEHGKFLKVWDGDRVNDIRRSTNG